jgi:hypothetical protein
MTVSWCRVRVRKADSPPAAKDDKGLGLKRNEEKRSMKSHGYAAHDPKSALVPFDFERREPGPKDVVVEIEFSGICHSDIHQAMCRQLAQR